MGLRRSFLSTFWRQGSHGYQNFRDFFQYNFACNSVQFIFKSHTFVPFNAKMTNFWSKSENNATTWLRITDLARVTTPAGHTSGQGPAMGQLSGVARGTRLTELSNVTTGTRALLHTGRWLTSDLTCLTCGGSVQDNVVYVASAWGRSNLGCHQIWTQSGSNWPQMGQIR